MLWGVGAPKCTASMSSGVAVGVVQTPALGLYPPPLLSASSLPSPLPSQLLCMLSRDALSYSAAEVSPQPLSMSFLPCPFFHLS